MLRSLDDMKNHQLLARDKQLGGIKDFLVDDATWSVRFLVVNTGNWLTGRKVLVSPAAVEDADGERQTMTIGLTRKQIEEGPSVDAALPVSRHMEREFAVYFGWPAPLQPVLPVGIPNSPADESDEERSPAGRSADPGKQSPADDSHHLRSVEEITGYHIQADDDEVGHLDDLIVDDRTWTIRYLVVDTRNVLPGKKVLLSPDWVNRTDWADRKVHTDVTRKQIEESPEFHPEAPVNRRFEEQLYDFYGRPVYWEEKVSSGSSNPH